MKKYLFIGVFAVIILAVIIVMNDDTSTKSSTVPSNTVKPEPVNNEKSEPVILGNVDPGELEHLLEQTNNPKVQNTIEPDIHSNEPIKPVNTPNNVIEPVNTVPNEPIVQYQPIEHKQDNTFTYYIDNNMPVSNIDILESAVTKAFDTWSKYNPDLVFIETQSKPSAEIIIEWEKYSFGEDLHSNGVAKCEHQYIKCTLVITTGNRDCNNNYIQFSLDTVSNIIMHEFGHQLQIGHTSDQEHLMYGDRPPPIDPLDTMGYAIPVKAVDYDLYLGQRELERNIDSLLEKIDFLREKHDYIISDVDELKTQYNELEQERIELYASFGLPHPNQVESVEESLYNKDVILVDKINNLVNQIDELIDESKPIFEEIESLHSEYLELNEQFRCFPSVL